MTAAAGPGVLPGDCQSWTHLSPDSLSSVRASPYPVIGLRGPRPPGEKRMATLAQDSLLSRYEQEFPKSRGLFERARGLFPNGVTHDLRHLEPFPIYVERAQGAY